MEYCEGGSVLDLMTLCNKKLSEDEIAVIVSNMVHGLEFLHKRHIVHRDLKVKYKFFKKIDKYGNFRENY